jgi:ankyrin repeat protein
MDASTEFFQAVASGNVERVRAALASDPGFARVKDHDGATPLHYACLNGHRPIVLALLEHGADVNTRDGRFDATPAGWAIEYLREAGGLLAMEIDDVLFAIRQKDAEWVRRFVRRLPALAHASDAQGVQLAEYARASGSDEIARLFDAAAEPPSRDEP